MVSKSFCKIEQEEIHMKTKIGFGSGHVHNDIVANTGAGYGLLFFTSVIGISNTHAGMTFLIGNIVDDIAVTAFGFLADLNFSCSIYHHYGKFKAWNLMGTIFLTISYPLTFLPPLGILTNTIENEATKTVYYTGLFIILNLGSSITAIAHNSIILKLATCESHLVGLSFIKTSGTAVVCTLIYVVAYFCFVNVESKNLDAIVFTEFTLITTVAGVIECWHHGSSRGDCSNAVGFWACSRLTKLQFRRPSIYGRVLLCSDTTGCKSDESKSYEIFGISALLGISSYSMMVVSLSLVVALIGKNSGKRLHFDIVNSV